MKYATTQVDPLELERRAYDSLFDMMEEWLNDHPDATEDEAYDAVCFRVIPDRIAAVYDYEKDRRREQY